MSFSPQLLTAARAAGPVLEQIKARVANARLLSLEEAAKAYVAQYNPPCGEAARLARENNLNYGSLLNAVCALRQKLRQQR